MKVHLGNYRNHWISPYTIVEKVVFWKDWETYEAPWVEQVTNILYPICNGYNNVMHKLFPRKKKVRIDYWDTWNADDDLALIILPLLKKIKEDKQGAPYTEDEDVPEHLRSTSAPPKKNEWDTDDNHFKRWDWILDEMIWAMESIINEDEYEEKFWIQKGEGRHWVSSADGKTSEMKYTVEPKLDREYIEAFSKRQKDGLTLFGKYFRGLWT